MLTDKRKKEIFTEVDKRLADGDSPRTVFDAYSSEFSDREPLARKVTSYLSPAIKHRYRWQSRILVGIVIYFGVMKFIDAFQPDGYNSGPNSYFGGWL